MLGLKPRSLQRSPVRKMKTVGLLRTDPYFAKAAVVRGQKRQFAPIKHSPTAARTGLLSSAAAADTRLKLRVLLRRTPLLRRDARYRSAVSCGFLRWPCWVGGASPRASVPRCACKASAPT
ncbi:hypothetical protein MRX96_008282 [Rhipicephalus microplus]